MNDRKPLTQEGFVDYLKNLALDEPIPQPPDADEPHCPVACYRPEFGYRGPKGAEAPDWFLSFAVVIDRKARTLSVAHGGPYSVGSGWLLLTSRDCFAALEAQR